MYFDTDPCAVCGSKVELRARRPERADQPTGPVGSPDGVVGDADSTVDDRICTNSACATNQSGRAGAMTSP